MKRLLYALILCLASLPGTAQVTNMALSFEGNGRVSLGIMPAASSTSDGTTLQFWLCPQHWIPGSNIITWGSGLNIRLGSPGQLAIQTADSSFAFSDANLSTGNWAHVTLMLDDTTATMLVNNANEQTAPLSAPFVVPTEDPLLLGGGFLGRIDEVRLWNFILPNDYNRFWNNTIDKYIPSWKHVVAYWKFDQSRLASNVYDYRGKNRNGTFSETGVKRTAVTDNPKFVYRRNLAYADCSRFFDREVQKGQYLKSNVISMIGATAQADGSLKYKQPDNAGTITNGSYLESYSGRSGVLDLNGEGAKMNTGKETLIAFNNSNYLETTSAYTFMTWISFDTWTPGAFLIKKESSSKNGISLRLGEDQGEFILRCNGVEFTYSTTLSLDKWYHIGFSTNAGTLGSEFVFLVNSRNLSPTYSHTEAASTTLSGLRSTNCYIGQNLDAKLDETITWSQAFNADNIIAQGTNPIEPAIGKPINGAYARSVDGLWKYDLADDLGRDSYSTPEWFRMIKGVFDGYEGAYVTVSIDKWSDEFFTKINNNADYRQTLAAAIAKMGNEPFLDGVDYDFEWNNNWSGIGTLCKLVREQLEPGKIQAVSPHELYYSFPVDKMQYVDYFNFQDYGPGNKNLFTFSNYKNFFTKAKNYGYPVDKIMLSYATTTSGAMYSNGSRPASSHAEYYPTGWRSMPYSSFEYSQNSYDVGEGLTRYFTGMEQVWLRSEYMNANGCAGIFYWDMGNDTPSCTNAHSLSSFASYGVNSNVQKIIESVDVAAAQPEEYEFEATETEYYRIRGAADGHSTHHLYQNGDELFAGTGGGFAASVFSFEKFDDSDAFFLKANDGRYVQDRSKLQSTNSIYRFDFTPAPYALKSTEYDYPEGHYCFEQTQYTPGKEGFTDVQRCLKCNGDNEGVSTWGPWTAASHWAVEPLYGYDIYSIALGNGIDAISCLIDGYSGSPVIYSGGFIVLPSGAEITADNISATNTNDITVKIDTAKKRITVTAGSDSAIEQIEAESGLPDEIYDLSGRKLKQIKSPGIYIINGKKTLAK